MAFFKVLQHDVIVLQRGRAVFGGLNCSPAIYSILFKYRINLQEICY